MALQNSGVKCISSSKLPFCTEELGTLGKLLRCGTTLTVGENGNFSSIGLAIGFAIQNGVSSSNPYTIFLCGPSYTEDVNLVDGLTIYGQAATIIGTIFGPSSGQATLIDMRVNSPPDNPALDIQDSTATIISLNCGYVGSPTGPLVNISNLSGLVTFNLSGISHTGLGTALAVSGSSNIVVDYSGIVGNVTIAGPSDTSFRFGTLTAGNFTLTGSSNDLDVLQERVSTSGAPIFATPAADATNVINAYFIEWLFASGPVKTGDATFNYASIVNNGGGGAAPGGANNTLTSFIP
jgi:hypothetical protein